MKKFMDTLNEIDKTPLTSGLLIRAFRVNLGLTLKEMEMVTGIRESHLSEIENGKIDLSLKNAKRLAAAIGVRAKDLLFPLGDDEEEDREMLMIKKRSEKILAKKAA